MNTKRINKVLLVALAILSTCALANPENPTVVKGTAKFSNPNANTLKIKTGRKAIINWKKFNIQKGQTTRFKQRNRNSVVLNRVTGNNPSKIHGKLKSNGKVFLINQHGMMIGEGARINTAGFYGSTLNITNEDFLKGKLNFEGGGHGGIVNHGYIHAGEGGNVVLIAPDIENGGVIKVDNGQVILAAGEKIRITSLNDSSIEFDVESKDDNHLINLGDIVARQGAVRLFAGQLTHSGTINATGMRRNADGTISLVASGDIEVTPEATLVTDGASGGYIQVRSHHGDVSFHGLASARGQTRRGGKIEILGERVGLFGAARLDASGRSGGGTVLVGGDFQGGAETQTATQTQVGADVSIHADATENGHGGKAIVWADETTTFSGTVTARGGDSGGDGGLIEVSGKQQLGLDGSVDASAPQGDGGTILFDPHDTTIDASGPSLLTDVDEFLDFSSSDLFINAATITAATNLGSAVTIQTNNDLTVDSAILTDNAGGNGGDLTLQAGRSILINADIVTDDARLVMTANEFAFNGVVDADRDPGIAEITMQDGVTINTGTANLEITLAAGNDKTEFAAGDITLATIVSNDVLIRHNGQDGDNSILNTASGSITANSIFIDHDDLGSGPGGNRSIGTSATPMLFNADFIAAHIHGPSDAGIYINATDNGAGDVTVGDTCYGEGNAGCSGPHLIRGLDTDGGELVLNVNGAGLIVTENIDISGAVAITADNDISTNPDSNATSILIRGDSVSLTSNAGSIGLVGGSSDNLDASIETTLGASGDITIDAAVNFVLTEGVNSDAFVIADNGTNDLVLIGGPCLGCTGLGFDPRGNGNAESGVAAANFPVAVSWVGGVDLEWTTPGNWSTGGLPTGNADVTINSGATETITLSGGFHDVLSLDVDAINDFAILGASTQLNVLDGLFLNGANFTLDAGATLNLEGAGNLINGGAGFSNNGTIGLLSSAGTNVILSLTGGITTNAGTIVLDNSQGGQSQLSSGATIINTGTVQSIGSGAPNEIDGFFDNQGTLDFDHDVSALGGLANFILRGGILDLGAGVNFNSANQNFAWDDGTIFGTPTSSISGTPIQLGQFASGGNLTLDGGMTLFLTDAFVTDDSTNGPMTFNLNAGVLDVTGFLSVDSGSTFNLAGGTINLQTGGVQNDNLVYLFDATFNWSSGTIDGNSVTGAGINPRALIFIDTNAGSTQFNLSSASTHLLDNVDIQNFENLNFQINAGLDLDTQASIVNEASGLMTLVGFASINVLSGGPFGITNDGDIQKTGGGTSVIDPLLTNNAGGFVDVDAGLLRLTQDATYDGDFGIAPGATLQVIGTHTFNGTLGAGGTINTLSGTFINAGTLYPGGQDTVGSLNVLGSFVNTGTIVVDIQSTGTAGTNYDLFAINNQVDLQGSLVLNAVGGYTVTSGDSFTPITFASSISNSLVFTPIGAETVGSVYNPGSLDLVLGTPQLITFLGGDNTWNNPANWDLGIPTVIDNVDLGTFDITIAAAAAANSISLGAGGSLSQSGATFSLASDSTIDGDYNLNGGTLDLGGTLTMNASTFTLGGGTVRGGTLATSAGGTLTTTASSTLDAVTLDADLTMPDNRDITVLNGLTLGPSDPTIFINSTGNFTDLGFNGTQTFGGTGSVVFNGSSDFSRVLPSSTGTLTIGPGITISSGSAGGEVGSTLGSRTTLVQAGATVTANGQTVSVRHFTNEGTLQATSGGTLDLEYTWSNTTGSITADASTIDTNNAVGNSWVNTGTFDTTNGSTVNLRGTFTTATFESLTQSGTTYNLQNNGLLDNSGDTLALDATSASINMAGGEIVGGTLTASGGAGFLFPSGAGGGTFDGVTLDTDITLNDNADLTIQNGLTLGASTPTIFINSAGNFTDLAFSGTQTFGGTGSVIFNGTADFGRVLPTVAASLLTIGPGISIGSGSSGGQVGNPLNGINTQIQAGATVTTSGQTISVRNFTNGGTIQAVSGGTLILTDSWSNTTGSITADASTIDTNDLLNDTWTNTGTFDTTNGSTVNLRGTFTTATFESLTQSGTTYNLQNNGLLDNSGDTLALDATSGSINMAGGEIVGGTLTASGGAGFLFPSGAGGGTFDGVTLDTDITLNDNADLTIQNGLILGASTPTIFINSAGNFTDLAFSGTQTFGGTGSVIFNGTADFGRILPSAPGILTIGPGIAISSGTVGGEVGSPTAGRDTLIQAGATITASGQTIDVRNFTNEGTIQAVSGGTLILTDSWSNTTGSITADASTIDTNDLLGDTWTNTGTFDTTTGSTVNLRGTFTTATFESLTQSGTTYNLQNNGLLDNSGDTLALDAASGSINMAGGEILGGTLTASGGAGILFPSGAGGGTFDGVTLDTDITLNDNADLTIQNGLTLGASTPTIFINSAGNFTDLRFQGTQTFGGTGSVIFNGTADFGRVLPATNATLLTIGPGISIDNGTAGGELGSSVAGRDTLIQAGATVTASGQTIDVRNFTNEGTIQAVSGGTLILTDSWSNTTGSITADASTIDTNDLLGDTWTNTGTFDTTNGSTVNLRGTFTTATFESLTQSGTTYNLQNNGLLDNSGDTLALDAASGSINMAGGEILGGTLTASGGAGFLFNTTSNSTFNGVTLDTDITLNDNGDLTILNGLTLGASNPTIFINSTVNFTTLGFNGTQTFGGTGFVVFNGSASFGSVTQVANGSLLTIGAGITISTASASGSVGSTTVGRDTVLLGNVFSDQPGNGITLNHLTNNGVIRASNGGTISLRTGALTNDGTMTVGSGSSFDTQNSDFSNNATGTVEGGGNFDVGTGLFSNDGTVAPGVGPNNTDVLTIGGDYTQGAGGALLIELEGTAPGAGAGFHDQLVVTGTATLAGDLNVSNVNGFVPVAFDSFQVVDAGAGLAGTFNGSVILPASFDPPEYDGIGFNVNLLRAFAATISWDDGGAAGDWFDPLNWSTDTLPGALDDVLIALGAPIDFNGTSSINSMFTDQDFTISGGTLSVASSAQFDGDLSIAGGTLDNAGPTGINGTNFVFSSGTITGGGTVTTSASTTTTLDDPVFQNLAWFNQGTINWVPANSSSADLTLDNSTLTNQGTLNLQNVNAGSGIDNPGGGVLINDVAGVINASPTVSVSISAQFDNNATSGLFNVSTGTTVLANATSNNQGNVDISAGAVLQLQAGDTLQLNAGTDFNGSTGTLEVAGGTLDVNTAIDLSPEAMTLAVNANGSILQAQNLVIPDTFNFTSGTLVGSGTFTTPASSTSTLDNVTVQNLNWISQGTVNWIPANSASNDLRFDNTTFTNQGVFLIQNVNAGSSIINLNGSSIVNDVGGVINSDPTTDVIISTPVINNATAGGFNLLTGSGKVTILDDAGNTNQGNVGIGIDATLQVQGGDALQLNAGTDFTGSSGTLDIAGGTLDVNSLTDLTAIAMTLAVNTNGTIQQVQNLGIPDTFVFTSGTITGAGNFTTQASSTTTLDNVTIQNINWNSLGTVNWIPANSSSNDLRFDNSSFTNQGVLLLQNVNPGSTVIDVGGSSIVNVNNGAIDTDPATTLLVEVPVTNNPTTGGINVLAGSGKVTVLGAAGNTTQGNITIGTDATLRLQAGDSLQLDAGNNFTGSTGILDIAGGTLDVNVATDLSPVAMTLNVNSNGTILQAQNLTIPDTFNFTSGTLDGTGIFTTPASSTTTLDNVNIQNLNWISQGTVNWIPFNSSSNDLRLDNSIFTNQGTLLLQNVNPGSTVVNLNGSSIVNDINGVINSDPTTTVIIGAPVTNNATAGGFNLLGGSGKVTVLDDPGNTNQGNIVIGANATLQVEAGDALQLNGGTDFSGSSGVFNIAGGALDVNTPVDMGGLVVSLNVNSNGSITQIQNLTIPNSFNPNGTATLSGTGTFTTPVGSTTIMNDVTVIDINWINLGTVNWTPTDSSANDLTLDNVTFTNQGTLLLRNVNAGSSVIDLNGSSIVNDINGFLNADPSTTLALDVPITNNATTGGFRLLTGPGKTTVLGAATNTNQGNIIIANGATLQVQAGDTLQLNAGTGFGASSGTLDIAGGTLDVNTAVDLSGLAMTLSLNSNGTIQQAQNLVVPNTFNVNGSGTVTGSGTFTTPGSSTTTLNDPVFQNLTWINQGTVNWQPTDGAANDFTLDNTDLTNQGFLTLQNINAGSTVVNLNGSTLTNSNIGLVNVTGVTPTVIEPAYTNDGALDVATGSTLSLNGADLSLPSGSLLRGGGSFNGNVINNGGTVQPGGASLIGTFTVNGDFTNTAGSIEIEIQSTGTAGVNYDLLDVTGNMTFGGSLDLLAFGGYSEANGDSFTPINYATGAGSFATLNGIGVATVIPDYTAPDLDILFNVSGLVTWDAGGDGVFWNDPVNWSGDLVPVIGDDVSIGTFDVTIAAAANANTLSLAGGGSLLISGGTFTLAADSTLAGDLTIDGPTAFMDAGGTLTVNGTLTLAQGALNTAGTLTANGATNWAPSGGAANESFALGGAGAFNAAGGFNVVSVFDDSLSLNKALTINLASGWSTAAAGSTSQIVGGGSITSNTSITVDLPAASDLQLTVSMSNAASAVLTKNTGTGELHFVSGFDNDGATVINPGTGTLRLSGNGSHGGSFSVGDTLDLDNAGVHIFNAASTFTGSGQVVVSNADVTLDTAAAFAPLLLVDSPSTLASNVSLSFNNDVTVDGTANFNAIAISALNSLTLTGGQLSIAANSSLAGTLDIFDGNMVLGATLTINNTMNWSPAGNSVISGGGSLGIAGVLNILGNNNHTFSNITVNNAGVTNYLATGGVTALRLDDGSIFNNSGLFDIQNNVIIGNVSGAGTFSNFAGGILRKSAGTGLASIVAGISFTNSSATIDIQSGSLTVNGGALLTLDSTSLLQGSGTFIGAVDNQGTIRPGGALATGILSINGAFDNSGFVEIEIDNIAGGPGSGYDQLAIIGGNQANLGAGDITLIAINGYTVSNGDSLQPLTFGSSIGNSLTFTGIGAENINPTYNAASLDLLLTLGGGIFWDGEAGGVNNLWNIALNWSGDTVPLIGDDVTIGAFDVVVAADAAVNSLTLDTGFELTITGGTLTLGGDTTIDGDVTIDGGQLAALGTLDVGGNANLLAGALTSAANTSVSGATTWNNAAGFILAGAGQFNAFGGFNLGANLDSSTLTLNKDLLIGGASTWTDLGTGPNLITGSGSLTNLGGVTISNNAVLAIDVNFTNEANLTKSAGAGDLVFNGNFANSANVELQAATTSFSAAYVQSGGATFLNGGDMAGNVTLNGGVFAGSGTLTGNLDNNGGRLEPGGVASVGTLNITGTVTLGGGRIVIDIQNGGSPVAGVDYDLLAVGGQVDFGATLELNAVGGYSVTSGDTFAPITYASSTGSFAGINSIAGEAVADSYLAGNLSLTLTITTPFVWTGSGDGSTWNDPLNWNQGLPGSDSTVDIGNFDVTINSAADAQTLSLASGGSLTIVTGGALTITGDSTLNGSLALSGGSLDITGSTVTLAGNFDWNGIDDSTIFGGGSGVLDLESASNVTGTGSRVLDSVTVNNTGNFTYSSASLEFQNSSVGTVFNNRGIFNFADDVSIADNTGGGASAFRNRNNGTLVKSGGAGTSTIAATMGNTNNGSVRILSGTLDSNVATWTMNGGDVFSGFGTYVGDVVNNGGTVRPGSGALAGVLTLNGDYDHQSGALDMQPGDQFVVNNMTLSGPGSLNLGNGLLLSGNLTTLTGSQLVISGGALVTSGVVQLTGALLMDSGLLQLDNGGTLEKNNNVWRGGTISGGAPLVLGVSPGDSSLDLVGDANKTLDGIVLDMNQNDINVLGDGDLVLKNGAVVDNTNGLSFYHSSNGDIRGNGSFVNNGGLFANLAGNTVIGPSVVFVNDANSIVEVSGGSLELQGTEANDAATYKVAAPAALKLSANRTFTNALNTRGTLQLARGVSVAIPGSAKIEGDVLLDNALLDLNGQLLQLNGSTLSGSGVVRGDVVNNGVVVVSGPNNLGKLRIDGHFTQNNAGAVVVDVFNNGLTTRSDLLVVTGETRINGGSLVIGFTTNSLGLVTADFNPFDFQGGVSGNFSSVFDAGGNILLVEFADGLFTILGTAPDTPDTVIDDLVSFLDDSDDIEETVASNASEADSIVEELKKEDEEQGSLVCK